MITGWQEGSHAVTPVIGRFPSCQPRQRPRSSEYGLSRRLVGQHAAMPPRGRRMDSDDQHTLRADGYFFTADHGWRK